MDKRPSVARLRELFSYDKKTGKLTRLVTTSSRSKAGEVAGWCGPDGYNYVRIDTKTYKVSCVAWAMTTGEWSLSKIDHKNRNRSDDRFGNLRQASNAQNSANTATRAQSGAKGVYFFKNTGKWVAQIRVDYKLKTLGYFSDRRLAALAYNRAAIEAFGEFATLNDVENLDSPKRQRVRLPECVQAYFC